ncbi:hypothetical protein [Streptomyces sp. NPDC005805]|uniref:hypothetical protein n=1 Tax=Streptomyces sp. NPDC005805 TaxID=3157068 RepID=UPI0033F2558D
MHDSTGPDLDPGHDADVCAGELRDALAAHGITLLSLRVDLPSYAGRHPVRPLLALGNCNLATARALTAALRKGVA